jgi:hypothetical protein
MRLAMRLRTDICPVGDRCAVALPDDRIVWIFVAGPTERVRAALRISGINVLTCAAVQDVGHSESIGT